MPIHYEQDADHVVLITIDRPEARNAADMEHFKALREAWERFAADDQAWVAIITGVGEAFFAGADLKTYVPEITKLQKEIAEKGLTEINGYRLDDGTRAVLRNWPLYKPVIAAVNGFCTAGGMEMLGGCDIRVACPEAKFAVMEPKRGLFAGGGTTVRLPRQIPWPQAMEFLLCADLIPAERAYEMGLLNAIVPRDQLLDKAREYAARMIANAPLAVQATKESALKGLYVDEDAITQVREAARALRAALEQIDATDPATAQGAIAASVEVLTQARQGAAHRVREGEPDLERDLPDRGRQGRPEGVRREAQAGLAGEVTRDRPAHSLHHRRRGAHVASRGRRRRGRARAARDVGARRAARPSATRARPGCSARSTASRSCTARPGSTTTRSARLAERLGADPRHRHYSGIGGTTTQQLVNAHARSDAARRDGPRADHERGGAGDASGCASGRASATRRRSRPPNARRSRGSRRPIRSRSRTRCSRPGSRSRCSTTPGARASASASTSTGARIGEMLAPMTQIAARNPHAWYRVERTADGDRRRAARQPHGRLPVHQVHGRR